MALPLLLLLVQSPSAMQIVENVRAAVGFDQFVQSPYYEARGTAHISGIESKVIFAFGQQGEYLFSTDGPLGQARAFDGRSGWETDPTGAPNTLDLSDLQHQHSISWVLDHEWLDPSGPFEISLGDALPGGDSYTLDLKQKNGTHAQRVIVDKDTWLPKETIFQASGLDIKYVIDSWFDLGRIKFPKRIETVEGDLEGWFELDTFSPVANASFVRPIWVLAKDTEWSDAGSPDLDTNLTRSGHILVKPTIAGKDVGWFILDSGAGGMAIDETVAKDLGAVSFGEVNVGGVGGMLESDYVSLADFQLGSLTVKSLNFVTIDLKLISGFFGVEVGGIVGFEFFRRAVTEIDLDTGSVSIFDPSGYSRSDAVWQNLMLDGRHPTYVCSFEGGYEGRFRLDTGASGTVTFNTPTVERFGLLNGRETTAYAAGGVGGSVRLRNGKMTYFELSGERFENVDVSFATEKKGVFAEDFLAGNIGQDLLKRFTIVFDYANERMALVPKIKSSATR